MMESIRVLIIDDDPIYRRLLSDALRNQASEAEVAVHLRLASSLAEAQVAIAADPAIDVIISDLNLGDSRGSETYRCLTEQTSVPLIAITADNDERRALEALGNGVADFLFKAPGEHLRILRTVTHVLQRQRALDQQQLQERTKTHQHRLLAMGTMSAGIAHEFNNLLTVLSGNLELTLRSGLEERVRQRLLRCLDAVARARDITEGLLDLARDQQPVTAICRLDTAARDIIGLLGEKVISDGVSLDLDIAIEPIAVRGHQNQIGQVVLNLCQNAVHAMSNSSHKKLSIRVQGDDEVGKLIIQDTGSGISKDVLPRIFDPFFTTKSSLNGGTGPRGTGLGLAVCDAVVQRYGGSLEVHSTEGEGTTFTVLLPRIVHEEAISDVYPTPQSMSKERRALVVEDEDVIRGLLVEILTDSGYVVVTSSNGREATDRIESGEVFDLICLDWHMPIMGGREFLGHCGGKLAQTLTGVVVVTAMPTSAREAIPPLPGLVWTVCPKPFTIDAMEAAVASIAAKRSV